MLLGTKNLTLGNKRRTRVEYDAWLEGTTLVSVTVSCPDPSVTISGVRVASDNETVVFFVQGDTLNGSFTVSIQVTNSKTEVKNDTINFVVVAP